MNRRSLNVKEAPGANRAGTVKNNPVGLILLGLLLLVLGGIIGGDMLVSGYSDQRVIRDGTRTEGTVTDVQERAGSKRRYERVTVTYRAAGGGEFTVTDSKRRRSIGFTPTSVDTRQTVYYRPDDPTDAVILGWDAKLLDGYLVVGTFGGGGALLMAVNIRRLMKMPPLPLKDPKTGTAAPG